MPVYSMGHLVALAMLHAMTRVKAWGIQHVLEHESHAHSWDPASRKEVGFCAECMECLFPDIQQNLEQTWHEYMSPAQDCLSCSPADNDSLICRTSTVLGDDDR